MAEVILFVIGIVILSLCLLLTLLALLFYSGLLEGVEVKAGTPPLGEAVVAYKFSRGPYKGAGQFFSETCQLIPVENKYRCLGIYYDDPKEVEESKLRYAVGIVLSENGSEVEKDLEQLFVSKGYKICKLPAVSHAVKTTFPFKSSLSIFIAVARVYPKIEQYIKENKLCAHPILEIYDSKLINFMAPLARQDEFYVEEANQTSSGATDDNEEDDNRSFLDDSTRDTSVCRSEASFTTYVSSYAGDDVSDIDEDDENGEENDITGNDEENYARDDEDEVSNGDNASSCIPQREMTPTSMEIEKRAITPETQTSGVSDVTNSSSQSVTKASQGPSDKPGDLSDGNDSASSFEEINFDPKDPLYVKSEVKG